MRTLPAELIQKIKSQYQTKANNANPEITISIARAKTTVSDTSYFTTETIRAGQNLGDVSLAPQRLKPYGSPSRIYEIHVENNEVKTSIREYPDKLKKGWVDQFSLGQGKSVAIAFDGNWERYKKYWRLKTSEKPWIFWVNLDGILFAQLWDDENTKVQLDTNVKHVRAIRAWKNVNFLDMDQGIVVGYIKENGTVWYRNYCTQIDGTQIWEVSRQITQFTGVADYLNLFITNDYRLGFVIQENSGAIYWAITPRNWAGMGFESHTIPAVKKTKIETNLIPITYLVENHVETLALDIISQIESRIFNARITNEIIEAYNIPIILLDGNNEEYEDWGYKVRFKTLYEFDDISRIELVDSYSGYSYGINVTPISLYRFEIEVVDPNVTNGFNNTRENLIVRVTNAKNPAGYAIQDFEYSFTPINLVPENIPPPEVEAIWNE